MRTPAIALLLMTALLGAAACATAPMTALPADVKWVDHPAFPGVKLAILHGNPAQPGPFVVRLLFPANYQVPPHFHPNDENVTVISGRVNIGFGDRIDRSKAQRYASGEFVRVPATQRHYAWTTDDTVIQSHGAGPTSVTWVNPADKPGKM
jgi:quercetin dioxygenase-like cupin family protein